MFTDIYLWSSAYFLPSPNFLFELLVANKRAKDFVKFPDASQGELGNGDKTGIGWAEFEGPEIRGLRSEKAKAVFSPQIKADKSG